MADERHRCRALSAPPFRWREPDKIAGGAIVGHEGRVKFFRHFHRSFPSAWIVPALLLPAVLFFAAPPAEPALRFFERVLLLEEKGETSAGVSIGDLNGDGHPDIVLAKGRHWPLYNRILLNDGKGNFTAKNLGEAPNRTYSAALADLDRDGDLDLAGCGKRNFLAKNSELHHYSEPRINDLRRSITAI